MSVKLKSITSTSWLVVNDADDSRVGLLTEIRNQYILMIKGEKQKFVDRAEVNKFFDKDVFVDSEVQTEVPADEATTYYINGFPVDFAHPHEVIIAGNKLPLYSKKKSSEVYYSAGYYSLNFPKNWMPAYCPKLSTLETYEYAGPFKTEIEMKTALSRLRKDKNVMRR